MKFITMIKGLTWAVERIHTSQFLLCDYLKPKGVLLNYLQPVVWLVEFRMERIFFYS